MPLASIAYTGATKHQCILVSPHFYAVALSYYIFRLVLELFLKLYMTGDCQQQHLWKNNWFRCKLCMHLATSCDHWPLQNKILSWPQIELTRITAKLYTLFCLIHDILIQKLWSHTYYRLFHAWTCVSLIFSPKTLHFCKPEKIQYQGRNVAGLDYAFVTMMWNSQPFTYL